MYPRHSSNHLAKSLASTALAVFAVVSLAVPVLAQGSRINMQSNPASTYGDSTSHNVLRSALGHPGGANQLDSSMPGGKINYGDHGETGGPAARLTNPGTVWPEITPAFPTIADERTAATFNELARVTGVNNPTFGAMPATAMGVGLTMAAATQLQADYEADPQNSIDRAKEEQNQANQNTADVNAQMERNQAGAAIDFCASYLYNFTVEANNKWNLVRNQLFLPMALLLLLPGVVLAQLKATVSAGTPVINDITSPFDGILRAIVGIFLIPGTYLFINYGIDVSNAITFTIQDQYKKIFHSDMYKDAMCAHIRAFPYRNQRENLGHIINQEADMTQPLSGRSLTDKDAFAKFETQNLEVALRDPCAKLNKAPRDRSNELVPYVVNAQRNSYNTGNAALAMTWNILCAFQMAYLYYLWFVGPVIAALWVYPMKELRDAFPAWINGVCTICFWSLFWNTTVLLMACCRGVDETGTLIMSALNFLSTACVKFAFDFAGLVREAGMQAAQQAQKGGAGAAGAAGGKGAQGAPGQSHHTHGAGHQPQVPSYATHAANAVDSRVPGGGTGDSRTVDSPSRAFSLDSPGPGTGEGTRSLFGGQQDGGSVGLDSFAFTPPPTEAGGLGHGHGHSRSLLGHADLLNGAGSPLTMSELAAFTGGGDVGSGDVTMDGDDIDFNDISVDGAALVGGAATHGMPHVDAGGVHGAHGHGGHNVDLGDSHHNTHHNAMHLSQNDLQNLFMNSGQAAAVRDQLMQQMNMPGGAGGVFVDGSNGASSFISASQLSQAFAAADSASAMPGGDSSINVSNLLSSVGVDLPAASFSGLNMSPIAATSMSGNGSFVPPGSDGSMSRGSLDPNAIASASGIPLTSGQGGGQNGVVPPDVVNAQRQATLDRISNEVQSSMGTIQAQNQQRAEQQAQQFAQQQIAQQQMALASTQQNGPMSSIMGGSGNNTLMGSGGADPLAGGPMGPNDLQRQALDGMAGVYRNAADIVTTGGGGTISAGQLGNLDPAISGASYAAASLGGANVSGVVGGGTNSVVADASGGGNNNQLPTNVQGGGNALDASGGGVQRPDNMAYLRDQAHGAWMDKDNGFEARMINQSIADQTMARNSTNDALTHGRTLQDTVSGGVSGTVPQNIDTSGGGSQIVANNGYTASSPASYSQASYTTSGGGDTTGGVMKPMDPISQESLNSLAKQLDVTPEVRSMAGQSQVGNAGLISNATGGETINYAQNSVNGQTVTGYTGDPNANATTGGGNAYQVASANTGDQRLGSTPQPADGGSGYQASLPKADAASAGQQMERYDMSGKLAEQWKNYDQNVQGQLAADYKAQMNGAVESTYSRASASGQDNMMGQASQLPTNQGGGMQPGTAGGGNVGPTFVADNSSGGNSGMNYQAPAPAAGSSFARDSAPQYADAGAQGGGVIPGHAPNNEVIRQQMDQLADTLNYTPEVNVARHSHYGVPGGDAGIPNSVPNQGLQFFAQQSYTSTPDAMQSLPTNVNRQNQQLPTNYQAQPGDQQYAANVPVPMQLRNGNVANSRADALRNATRAKESYRGGGDDSTGGNGGTGTGNGGTGNGGKTNKLSNALGKAASVNSAKKAAAAAAAGAKSMKDPLGSVATGSTLRRLRNKRKWSEEELEAMRKLGGGADPDWEM